MSKCTYCESTEHNIKNCPIDSELYNSLVVNAIKLPEFESMTHKVLKKLAALSGNKTSLPKAQLIAVLTKAWHKLNEEKKNLEEETSCPICFLDFSHKNVCVTKCGHKFCLECILTHHKRKNDCPLCRAELCKEIKPVRPKSASRRSNIPVNRQPTQPMEIEPMFIEEQPNTRFTGDDYFRVSVQAMHDYQTFEQWYSDHYGFQVIGSASFNLGLLSEWNLIHPYRVPRELFQPNFSVQNYIRDIRAATGSDNDSDNSDDEHSVTLSEFGDINDILHQNVTTRTANNNSLDLMDLMETHNEIVDLFQNNPTLSPILNQNNSVQHIDL